MMRFQRVNKIAWMIGLIIGFAAMLIVPILFFYPLYWNFVTREPVLILFNYFHEPLEWVLLIEMGLCVAAWFTAFFILVFFFRKLRTPPRLIE